jgi:hypothetical protein
VGITSNDCDFIVLYPKVSCRISSQEITSDTLQKTGIEGKTSSDLRKIILTPSDTLRQAKRGDYLQVPWGYRPNNFIPINLSEDMGPWLWLETPSVPVKLIWNNVNSFVGPGYSLNFSIDTWCFSGGVTYCFPEAGSFVCQDFPEGYSLLSFSGPSINYEILRINEHQDNLGKVAFYTVYAEHKDKPEEFIQ